MGNHRGRAAGRAKSSRRGRRMSVLTKPRYVHIRGPSTSTSNSSGVGLGLGGDGGNSKMKEVDGEEDLLQVFKKLRRGADVLGSADDSLGQWRGFKGVTATQRAEVRDKKPGVMTEAASRAELD